MKKSLLAVILVLIASNIAFADSVIVTETKSWKSVPITVDPSTDTYTVVGTVPADTTDYYYTYSGYRCFITKRTVSVNPVTLKATASQGQKIYCYPES